MLLNVCNSFWVPVLCLVEKSGVLLNTTCVALGVYVVKPVLIDWFCLAFVSKQRAKERSPQLPLHFRVVFLFFFLFGSEPHC